MLLANLIVKKFICQFFWVALKNCLLTKSVEQVSNLIEN